MYDSLLAPTDLILLWKDSEPSGFKDTITLATTVWM